PPPPPPLPPAAPTPALSTGAQVVKSARKKTTPPSTKPTPAVATLQTTPKVPSPKSSVSVTTTAKEKTTPNFSPSFFLIGRKPLFSGFTPSFTEKEVNHTTIQCLPLARKARKSLPSIQRYLLSKESCPLHPLPLRRALFSPPPLSDHEATQPPLCATTRQNWIQNNIGISD